MDAVSRAIVTFEKRTIGTYAGQWTIVGRRGKVVPKIEAGEAKRNLALWSVTATERVTEKDADEEIPAYTVTTKTVFVAVPWRTSATPLTAEEIERVVALAAEQVGKYTVID